MSLENTEKHLQKFDFDFQKKNNQLFIKMGFSLRIIVDFSNPEKMDISDKLVGGNFLTGFIETSIRNALLLNCVGIIIGALLFTYSAPKFEEVNVIFFFIGLIFWVLLWTNYYLSKSEI